MAAMVMIWSLRLATFLFLRILKAGSDSRFGGIKNRPQRFLMAWTLQGLWMLLTAAAGLAVITGGMREPLGAIGIAGIALWLLGILIEIVADRQKSKFNNDPDNEGKFINVGQWATLISPVFVVLLLTRVSGIHVLEEKAGKRWGGQENYEDHKRKTPVLIPKPPAMQA